MGAFIFIGFMAVIVEGIIEYLGVAVPSRFKMYVAAALGVVACVLFRADLFAIVIGMMRQVGVVIPDPRLPWAGEFFTGLLVGRGSNYINTLVSFLQVTKAPSVPVADVLPPKGG